MSATLGIDYGATETKLLMVDGEDGCGAVVARSSVPTGDIRRLADDVRAFVCRHDVVRFAVTVAGTLDATSGRVGRSTNMPWLDGVAPAVALSDAVGIPGIAVQDGVATATAEATLGAGRDDEDVFVIALGTGVAGAHVVDGQIRSGAHGAAGEVGHLVVGGTHECSCGQVGCLETFIGGAQLGQRWQERTHPNRRVSLPAVSAKDVIEAAAAGDVAATGALAEATDALARALLHVSALIDPGTIVLGGGLSRSPEWTILPAFDEARRAASFHHLPALRLAELGVWAGARGAALCAANRALSHT